MKTTTQRRSWPAWVAAVSACALAASAHAGSVQVTVLDRDGKPAADVVVLIDTTQRAILRPAAEPVVVLQEGLRFQPFLTVLAAGSTLRFVNRDDYEHHVRSTPSGPLGAVAPASSFELRLAAQAPDAPRSMPARGPLPPTAAEVVVNTSGPIGLGCHFHSSMRGQVYVSATPWFGKTDAKGTVTIDGVPEGSAQLRLWHSDQLQEQPAQTLAVTAAPLKADAGLNFTPRRRRN